MRRIITIPGGNLLLEEKNGLLTQCRWTNEYVTDPDSSLLLDLAVNQIREFFAGTRHTFSLPIVLRGTDFQLKVWRALTEIPYGETRTYGQIAAAIGCPGGSRAVAQACSRNPFCVIIPCHRVVASNGLGGYTAPNGLATKLHLLSLESQSTQSSNPDPSKKRRADRRKIKGSIL